MAATTGIYICPQCQAAVKGGADQGGDLVCPECQHQFGGPVPDTTRKATAVPGGRAATKSSSVIRNLTARKATPIKPVGVINKPVLEAKTVEQARLENQGSRGEGEIIMPDGTRRVRRRKRKKKDEKNKGLVFFLLGWLSVVALIIALFKMGGEDTPEDQADEGQKAAQDTEARNLAVMRRILPQIDKQFRGFLFHPSLDGREQFINRSADLSYAFSRFYENEIFPKPDSDVTRIAENVLALADEEIAIETIWESEGGHKWGAVHVFDKVESWKLDWECFAPYSTESWTRFRANLGAREGVFRLLVRKRRSTSKKDYFTLSFYRAPKVFETDNEYKNTQSPEVEVPTDSEVGKQFLKLWGDYLEGRAPYGSILADSLDPRNHLRITVRLVWEKDDLGESQMVLKEIVGVGWFGQRIQELHQKALEKVAEEAAEKFSEETSGE